MSDRWWEKYEWGRVDHGHVLHAAMPGREHYAACGLRVYGLRWDAAADLPRCKTCERVIAATAKRYEGGQPK